MDLLRPGLLGASRTAFAEAYGEPALDSRNFLVQQRSRRPAELRELLGAVLLRRDKATVAPQLPAKRRHVRAGDTEYNAPPSPSKY